MTEARSSDGSMIGESWARGSARQGQRRSWFMRGFDARDPRRCTTFDETH